MNIWLLSHLGDSPGTRITVSLFEELGHTVRHVAPREVHLRLHVGDGPAFSHSVDGGPPDLVYTRLGSSAPPWGLDVLRHFEAAGVPCINGAQGLEVCRDKFRSCQRLAAHGLPIPETVLIGPDTPLESALAPLGPAPWIVKLPVGTKGAGVSIVDSMRSLRSVIDMLNSLDQRVIVQRFIEESRGSDVRVIVLGGRAVLAVRRTASGDEFRSNVALGGVDTATALDPAVAAVAEQAAASHHLAAAGVDILESHDGPMIAEVNGSPGLVGPLRRAPEVLRAAFDTLLRELPSTS